MSSGTLALLEQARERYLAQPLTDSEAARIEEKYKALAPMVQRRSRSDDAAWKGMVARFPGCLREAEMCRVSTIVQRAQAALSFQERVGEARQQVLADSQFRPLLIWDHVHAMLRDIQTWRGLSAPRGPASGPAPGRGVHAFWRWTQSNKPAQACDLWPANAACLQANRAGRPDQYTAYQWMADLLCISQGALLEELLDRLGVRRGQKVTGLDPGKE